MIEIEDVKCLHLNPGDVLVAKIPRSSSYSAAHATLQEFFPNNRVLIVHPDVELMIVEKGTT